MARRTDEEITRALEELERGKCEMPSRPTRQVRESGKRLQAEMDAFKAALRWAQGEDAEFELEDNHPFVVGGNELAARLYTSRSNRALSEETAARHEEQRGEAAHLFAVPNLDEFETK